MAENQHQKKSSYLLSSIWFFSPAASPYSKAFIGSLSVPVHNKGNVTNHHLE